MSEIIVYPKQEMQKVRIGATNTGIAKVTEAFKLPIGADIESVSIEVSTAFAASTTIKIGTSGDDDLFFTGQALSVAGSFVSNVKKETNKPETLIITTNQVSAVGEAILRVHYALPTTEKRDY